MIFKSSPFARLSSVTLVAFLAIGSSLALASGSHESSHAKKHDDGHSGGHSAMKSIGEPGKASEVTRTIEIVMNDSYFEPEVINVKKGETIRFVVKNQGEFVHEFNLGTAAMHADHQQEMMAMMEHGALEADKINHDMMKMDMGNGKTMEHNDPNSVLLEPAKNAEVIWKFSSVEKLEFACNVPGHYESGMMGEVHFN
ncbi:MAG: cupredoxin domain-containing protein [Sneathiella sp.]|nr:cupredoxin domain-containing protein [Sneathiella sp.]